MDLQWTFNGPSMDSEIEYQEFENLEIKVFNMEDFELKNNQRVLNFKINLGNVPHYL